MGAAFKLEGKAHISLEERISYLNDVSILAEIKGYAGSIEYLAHLMDEQHFAKGSPIIVEGAVGHEMYFLMHGEVAVFKSTAEGDDFPVAILKEKDHVYFGEGALLDDDTRSASLRANSDCICLVFNKASFDQFCKEKPAWALPFVQRVARMVMGRLRKSNSDFVLLYNALVTEMRGGG